MSTTNGGQTNALTPQQEQHSTIQDLVVLQRLTIDQLRVQPRRVQARYQVTTKSGESHETEMTFSYDNPYFDPKNIADCNLAAMMVAQVAINYGLFFEEIVFDGPYDAADQQFIRYMMENTAREVLVMKFLGPNEFLIPPFNQLKVAQHERYTAASIRFINSDYPEYKPVKEEEPTDQHKYAILSSGGKDSLLTYGLVQELGEAHPVFVNESGRHWFTAVNAYRYFREHEPNTAKPWTNCDRVFNWMLRFFPFIKPNYQRIRADIYPIRMYTVAVFLFAVLPVARKRKVGNVLIGNEYDTTMRGLQEGISHYYGLYDQSKYFDNALTRYYKQKGWQMRQYSLLRSLSELLILKVLVKRYPDLQALQVSCHAAHEKEGQMKPCGNCEKCRRIIGMLTALDEDPRRCGYTSEQIERGLKALSEKSVKQIGSDAAHLYHLLVEGGHLPVNEHTKRLAKQHPEIMNLRFDQERSRLDDLPAHILEPLFKIYESYAEGTVEREDRKWKPTNFSDLSSSRN